MARILLVTNIFPPQIGGPATFNDRLAHSLGAHGHKVTVVCSSTDPREPSDAARPFVVRRVSLASREQYEIRVRMRLALEMARHRFVFVNGLERYVAEANIALRRRYVLKVVGDTVWETARNRGLTSLSIDDFQVSAAAQAAFRSEVARRNSWLERAHRVVVPSDYLAGIVTGWGIAREKVLVIRNGAELRAATMARRRPPGERLRALFVGRLTNWKGVETLLLAIREKSGIDVEIVGDGPGWPHLTGLAVQLGLNGRATFLGRLDRHGVEAAMARAHVLVLTSLYEGLSHTVLEALAVGLPCVVSDRGGNPELIQHERNGLVVPAENVERLGAALCRLAADEDFRGRLASAARETVRAFDLEKTVARTEAVILGASGAA